MPHKKKEITQKITKKVTAQAETTAAKAPPI